MLTEKEFVLIRTQTTNRDAAIKSARHYATCERTKYFDNKYCAKLVRDAVKNARKANRKIVAAKAAGTARPVGVVLAAVLPLMETFAKGAADRTAERIAEIQADVAAKGFDVAYPEPKRPAYNNYSRTDRANYDHAVARRSFAASVTQADEAKRADFITHTIENAVHFARAQFLGYAWKLDGKVGEVVSAKLTTVYGVWGESFLDVTKADGSVIRWKTQTITNYSVYGTPYFQWPTRVVKM